MSNNTHQFRVGDRVRSMWHGDRSYGHEGKIVEVAGRGSMIVSFDETPRFIGWPYDSKNPSCWYISPRHLVLLEKDTRKIKSGSQEDVVLRHLMTGETLTRIQADHLYRVASLTKVISRLRGAGHKIDARWKVDPTGRPYKSYSLRQQKKGA